MVDTAPLRTLAQRMEALQGANEIRTRRAVLKRDLKAGRKDARAFLLEPPDWAGTMKVFDFLMALPKTGRSKTNKILKIARVSPSKTLAGLSDRQRLEVVSLLRPSLSEARGNVDL